MVARARRITLALCAAFVAFHPHLARASVDFLQINWTDGAGGYTAFQSEYGRVQVGLTPADAAFLAPTPDGRLSGFINLVTTIPGGADNWAVQNMPLVFNDAADIANSLPKGYFFDLTTLRGAAVTTLQYRMSITPTALPSAPSGPATTASVLPLDYFVGGASAEPVGPPEPAGNTATTGDAAANVGKIKIPEKDVPFVQEGVNGCVPGSIARSLKYLDMTRTDFNLPTTPQETYDAVNTGIGRVGNAQVDTQTIQPKKKAYTESQNYPITTETSTDFEKVIAALNAGSDVELVFRRPGIGSHMAFVSQITPMLRNGEITEYVVQINDDNQSTSTDTENRSTNYVFTPTGRLTGGDTGRLQFFLIESIPEPSLLPPLIPALALLRRNHRRG